MADRLPRAELVAQLGATVGNSKAQAAIDSAAALLSIADDALDQAQCLLLLERMAAEPNIVGIASRLLKVQILLRFGR